MNKECTGKKKRNLGFVRCNEVSPIIILVLILVLVLDDDDDRPSVEVSHPCHRTHSRHSVDTVCHHPSFPALLVKDSFLVWTPSPVSGPCLPCLFKNLCLVFFPFPEFEPRRHMDTEGEEGRGPIQEKVVGWGSFSLHFLSRSFSPTLFSKKHSSLLKRLLPWRVSLFFSLLSLSLVRNPHSRKREEDKCPLSPDLHSFASFQSLLSVNVVKGASLSIHSLSLGMIGISMSFETLSPFTIFYDTWRGKRFVGGRNALKMLPHALMHSRCLCDSNGRLRNFLLLNWQKEREIKWFPRLKWFLIEIWVISILSLTLSSPADNDRNSMQSVAWKVRTKWTSAEINHLNLYIL